MTGGASGGSRAPGSERQGTLLGVLGDFLQGPFLGSWAEHHEASQIRSCNHPTPSQGFLSLEAIQELHTLEAIPELHIVIYAIPELPIAIIIPELLELLPAILLTFMIIFPSSPKPRVLSKPRVSFMNLGSQA